MCKVRMFESQEMFMKKYLFAVLLSLMVHGVWAQRITRSYNNRSMSEVLKDLGKSTKQYKLSFIYNELEDFTVTTSFRNLSLQEALGQVFGFYPIKATIEDSLIFVECTQKEPTKLMGRVVDEHRRPVEFANVVLLNPTDSAFITGGVTNASGHFVIPCGVKKVIVKISCVGYHTLYNIYNVGRVGNVVLKESTMHIKGVTVKAKLPSFKMGREGMQIDIQHSDLSKVGDATDVLRELPRINMSSSGEVSVFGKGTPIIYINNKQVRDTKELQRLKSDEIKNVEIITSPGARYDASVGSVIRIRTVKKQGEGLSGSLDSKLWYNGYLGGREQFNLNYQTQKLSLFGTLFASTNGTKESSSLDQTIESSQHIRIAQYAPTISRSTWTDGVLGFNYDFNDSHSIGGSYSINFSPYSKGHTDGRQNIYNGDVAEEVVSQHIEIEDVYGPEHDANIYYVGKVNKLGIDFNGTYVWKKSGRDMSQVEKTSVSESRDVHTTSRQHNQLIAGKIVLSYPVAKGSLALGSEVSHTKSNGMYSNEEGIVEASSTDVREDNVAGFLAFSYPMGNFGVDAGLRYEYVSSKYYSFGEYQEEPSKKYGNWFPNLTLSWNKKAWAVSLAYNCKTQRPSYNSLRNDVQYDNRYMYEGGNPYLRPTINHDVALDVMRGWLSLGVDYLYEDNPIIWYATLYQGQDITFLRNMNFSHNQTMTMYVVAAPKFDWYQPTWQFFFQKPFFDAEKYGAPSGMKKPAFGFTWNNKFKMGTTCVAWLTLHANTASYNAFQRNRSGYFVSMRMVKSFYHDALNMNLYADDIFRSQKEQWTMYGDHVTLTKDSYNCSREIGVRVTYKFNATRNKYKGSGAGNAEKNRF